MISKLYWFYCFRSLFASQRFLPLAAIRMSSSSSSSEETNYPSDNQLLKNGDFEYTTFTKKDTDFPVYGSSTNWTRGYDSVGSSQAVSNSSKYSDGIIDTADDAYNAIKANKYLPEENPRTPEYLGLVDDELYNIADYENGDGKSNEDKLLTSGTKILMIHNKTSEEGQGTARKFTSSSFTLARNQFAKLSVWVKTVDLKSNVFGATYGAYIAIENTISSTAAPLVLKNIDTKGNWAKYTVYLSSSDFSTSAYRMVLGLGFGSAKVVSEYVEGYAFFDNAHMEIIDKTAYETAMGGVATENNVNLNELDGETYKTLTEKIVKDQKAQEYKANEDSTYTDETPAADKYTEVVYALSHTRANLNNYAEILEGVDAEKNKSDNALVADNAGVVALSEVYSVLGFEDSAKLPGVAEDQKAVFFNFSTNATGYSLTSKAITVKAKSYLKLSFWMKAEVKSALYSNALTVNVRDLGKTGANESGDNVVSTALVSNDSTKDYENDNYNGWKQYVLFVSNTVGEVDRDFELEFVFGTMDAIDKDEDIRKLTKGYAIVTDLEGYELSADDYSIADTSSYTYAKKVSLSADLPNGAKDDDTDDNDSFSFTYSESEKAGMYANGTAESVNGYQFVKAGSNAVGGENDNVYGYNSEEVAGGIINSKYNAGFKVIADLLQTDKTVQAMYLGAKADAVAYGFIGKSATLSANTTTYISVKVYATNGAIANFYLANPNALDGFNLLALNPVERIDAEKDADLKKEYVQTYTGTENGAWYTLAFLVTTGNETVTYRPEFWLGSRDNSASNGTVYFTDYTVTTVEKDQKLFELTNSGLKLVEGSEVKYTRIPTTIKYNPVTDETDSSSSGEKEVKEITEEYNAETIYCEYSNATTLVKSYDYTTVDVEHEIDKTTTSSDDSSSSSSEDSSTSADPTSFNWALQLTSIIIAAVLIVLLVVILIKNIVEKNKSKKSKSVEFYSRDSRAIAGEKAIAKKAENERKAAEAEEEEEVGEYDYNNPEINNNDKLNATEETAEEATEETTEATEETTEETTEGGSEGTDGSAE